MPTFDELKKKCLDENRLFDDPDFPARNKSIHPQCDRPADWLWRRPLEICDHPVFLAEDSRRCDLAQGEGGDCWFIAACSVLASRRDLLSKVIHPDQDFTTNYAGIFRFHIWRYGKWREVYVDDRLPVTVDNTLRYGQNRAEPNEFWTALLEKAYAKLEGSYHAIEQGHLNNALVDITGGISEQFNIRREENLPPDLFEVMKQSSEMGSLVACGVWSELGSMKEESVWNGLYKGHAYIVTKILETRIRGWHVQLLRLRDPWGIQVWSGPWSDGSEEWEALSEVDKVAIGLTYNADGEFWISFQDFLSNFHGLDIVHIEDIDELELPEAAGGAVSPLVWYERAFHGRWINGINSGGSGYLGDRNQRLYFMNPQYSFKLLDPDPDDVGGECTCVISVLQKPNRQKKVQIGSRKLTIGFDVHQVKTPALTEPLEAESYFEKAKLKRQHHIRMSLREVSSRFQLNPGVYCVVPYTLRPHRDGDYFLRLYTYSRIEARSLQEDVISSEYTRVPVSIERPITTFSNDMFMAFAGDEYVIDARDLRDLLSELARKEFGETVSFGIESCRSLIAMMDTDGCGSLDYDEMLQLWDEVVSWRKIFKKYDRDKSGCIETYELRSILKEIGFTLNLDTLHCLVVRYGGKDRNLFFEDFTICMARTKTLHELFTVYSKDTPGEARMDLDEWFSTMLYL